MVVINRLIIGLIVIVVVVSLLAIYYSDTGLFSDLKKSLLEVGDDIPGLEEEEEEVASDQDANAGS